MASNNLQLPLEAEAAPTSTSTTNVRHPTAAPGEQSGQAGECAAVGAFDLLPLPPEFLRLPLESEPAPTTASVSTGAACGSKRGAGGVGSETPPPPEFLRLRALSDKAAVKPPVRRKAGGGQMVQLYMDLGQVRSTVAPPLCVARRCALLSEGWTGRVGAWAGQLAVLDVRCVRYDVHARATSGREAAHLVPRHRHQRHFVPRA